MKKFLILFAILAVSLTLFACGGSNDYIVEDEYDGDKLIISFFGIELDSLQGKTTDDTKLIMDYIENKFQVKFKYISGTPSSWQTVLNQNIGGGDVPDIFFHDKGEPGYSTWLDDGYLFNFSEYLNDYPNLKNAFARYDDAKLKSYLGGDLYGYPIVMDSTTDDDIINEHALYYRRDWYKNLVDKGIELVDPEDPAFDYEDFYDLCAAFTNNDPDGNGKNDTRAYALTSREDVYWWYPITSMFGVTYDGWYYDKTQQKWLPDCTSENMKKAVWYMAKMLDNGFINDQYATTVNQDTMKSEFLNGKAGMMTYNATYPMGQGVLDLVSKTIAQGKNVSDVVRAMPVPTGIDGEKHMFGYSNKYGFNSINNYVTENKKKKIMSIMDWMLSEEGQLVLNYGLEGKHYEIENGEIKSLLGLNKEGYPKTLYDNDVAPGIYRIKGLVSWSTVIPTFINYYDEQMQLLQAWDRSLLVANPLAYCSVDPSFALKISSLERKINVCYTAIVAKNVSESERERLWNDFVKQYNAEGSAYIDAMNKSAQSLGIK